MANLATGKKATLRRLLNVIKPRPTLGKRAREDEDDTSPASVSPQPAESPNPTEPPCAHRACVALQNEDLDEDVIVITALNAVPFCCHADLVTMNRIELLGVADSLNTKLPLAMQIDTGDSRSDVLIRNSIEVLVGIRSATPELASKRSRGSRSVFETPRGVPPSPASPYVGRNRSVMSLASPPALAMLREEDEGSSRGSEERPQKRRRTAVQPRTPTFDPQRPITRSQSHRVAPLVLSNADSPTAHARVLRTRSQKLPVRAPLYPSIHANITVTRGRSATRGRGGVGEKKPGFIMTSTPKKRALAAVNSPESQAPRYRQILADFEPKDASSEHIEDVTFGLDISSIPFVDYNNSSDMDISVSI